MNRMWLKPGSASNPPAGAAFSTSGYREAEGLDTRPLQVVAFCDGLTSIPRVRMEKSQPQDL